MADASSLADLIKQLAFYRAGGKPEGGRDIDKLNTLTQNIGTGTQGVVSNYMAGQKMHNDAISNVLARKQAELKIKDTEFEQTPYRDIVAPISTTPAASLDEQAGRDKLISQREAMGPRTLGQMKTVSEIQKNMRPEGIIEDLKPAIASGYASRQFAKTIVPELQEGQDLSIGELKQRISQGKQGDLNSSRENAREDRIMTLFYNAQRDLDNNPILKVARDQSVGLEMANHMANLAKAGNTVAASALGMKEARGLGEVGVVTNQDVQRYIVSGRLTQRAADILSQWLLGTPTEATLEEIQQINNAVLQITEEKKQAVYNNVVDRMSANTGLPKDQVALRMGVTYKGAALTPEEEAERQSLLQAQGQK